MNRFKITSIYLLIFLTGLLMALGQSDPAFAGSDPTSEIYFSWDAPALTFENQPDGTVIPTVSEFDHDATPGAYQLPMRTELIVIPAGTKPQISIDRANEQTIVLDKAIAKTLYPNGVQIDDAGNVIGGAFEPTPDSASEPPRAITFPIQIETIGSMGGVQLGRITFYPLHQPSDINEWRMTTHISFKVTFIPETHRQAAPTQPTAFMRSMLESVVANPEHLPPVAERSESKSSVTARSSAKSHTTNKVFIEVSQRGLTAVEYADLIQYGIDPKTLVPAHLQLSRDGELIAAEWHGDEDDLFEPGESLRFFADPRISRWTHTDAYLIESGEAFGSRITSRSVEPTGESFPVTLYETIRFEENQLYSPSCICGLIPTGSDGDRWMWQELKRPGNPKSTINFELPEFDKSHQLRLDVEMVGFSSLDVEMDHAVAIVINDAFLGHALWDGLATHQFVIDVPASQFKEGKNELKLSMPDNVPASIDAVWLDAFSVSFVPKKGGADHQQILKSAPGSSHQAGLMQFSAPANRSASLLYDISMPSHPVKLIGFNRSENSLTWTMSADSVGQSSSEFIIADVADLHQPISLRYPHPLTTPIAQGKGADYILITPAAFLPALNPLIALREAQGLTVAVETVEGINDHYGDGRFTPQAIRNYIETAYTSWSPRPSYVVLVGDGSVDPKGYQPDSKPNRIHPYLVVADPWIGETAADNRYVAVDGNDTLPDMALGRLPVNSLEETKSVVAKIVEYESTTVTGNWNRNLLLVADNPDKSLNFSHGLETIANSLEDQQWRATVLSPQTSRADRADQHKQLMSALYSGVGMVVYSGHSSIHQWGTDILLHLNDLTMINNDNRLPIVVGLTCLTGSFHLHDFDTLDEALLRSPSGGAVAVMGSTGLGVLPAQTELGASLINTIYLDQQPILGHAITASLLELAADQPFNAYLVDTYILLGDPATQVNLKIDQEIYLPLALEN